MNLSKFLLKPAVVLCVLAGFLSSPKLISHFAPQSATRNGLKGRQMPSTINSAPIDETVSAKQNSPGLPVRLKIPKINLNAEIEYVGLTPQGEVGVPIIAANAAWYNGSPLPGQKGNAVIDGHSGWEKDIPAVFDDLHKLQMGDKLYVEDEDGATTIFVIRELRTYSQNDIAQDVFNSNDDKAHLNLITCQGQWDQTQKSYANRFVIFADKEV